MVAIFKSLYPSALAASLVLAVSACSSGSGSASQSDTNQSQRSSSIANRCSIGIKVCLDKTVNLPTVLGNSANAASSLACESAAHNLKVQCKLPYPIPVSFYVGGKLQTYAMTK